MFSVMMQMHTFVSYLSVWVCISLWKDCWWIHTDVIEEWVQTHGHNVLGLKPYRSAVIAQQTVYYWRIGYCILSRNWHSKGCLASWFALLATAEHMLTAMHPFHSLVTYIVFFSSNSSGKVGNNIPLHITQWQTCFKNERRFFSWFPLQVPCHWFTIREWL